MLSEGIEALAVCLINSHLRPDVERAVADSLASALPSVYVTASVDVSPEPGEYERTSTAVVNSYVGPTVKNYLADLQSDLAGIGVGAPVLVMQSNGGLIEADEAVRQPVRIIESGPAAGVVGTMKLCRRLNLESAVSLDMGGTTAKASLLEHGKPFLMTTYEVGGGMNISRGLSEGAGYPIRTASLDIAEVGAGGGSIVWTDDLGVLHVGPESAGADPGPACYDRGGQRPTLTDSNVVLGYLPPDELAGGHVRIRPERASDEVGKIAKSLGLDAAAVALATFDIAVSNMTKAIKAVTSQRGRDPRSSAMVAFGGAGPLYAAAIAKELGISLVVVPPHPGLFSSLGLLNGDVERQTVRPWQGSLHNPLGIELALMEMESELLDALGNVGYHRSSVDVGRSLSMRYREQRFMLDIDAGQGLFDEEAAGDARDRFHAEHKATYGRAGKDVLVEVAALRVTCKVPTAATPLSVRSGQRSEVREPKPAVLLRRVDYHAGSRSSESLVPSGRPAPHRRDGFDHLGAAWCQMCH